MTWLGYGGGAYGGSPVGRPGLPGNALTVPDYATEYYYWRRTSGQAALGQAAYGGASASLYPSAGLLAAPDPPNGTCTIWVWWAYAAAVSVARVDPDGTTTPVRAAPVVLNPAGSRTNLASNPAARDTLTGYSAGPNTTLTRRTGLTTTPSPYTTTSVRATAAAAGSVTVNTTLDAVPPTATAFGFAANASAALSGLSLTVTWYDTTSTSLGATSYPVPAGQVAAATGQWSWCTVAVTTWPAGAATGVAAIVGTGLGAGGTLDVTERLIETGNTVSGPYFDGDFPASSWVGAAGLSASQTSATGYTVDAECPLDVPVQYEITSGSAPGYAARSNPVTLDSRWPGWDQPDPWSRWLTHPAYLEPIRVWIAKPPDAKRTVTRGIFPVMDSEFPVVVTGQVRQASTGQIVIHTKTNAHRAQLRGMLADTSPVLLRAPASYGDDQTIWVSLGDETVTYYGSSNDEARTLTYDYTVVAAPAYAA